MPRARNGRGQVAGHMGKCELRHSSLIMRAKARVSANVQPIGEATLPSAVGGVAMGSTMAELALPTAVGPVTMRTFGTLGSLPRSALFSTIVLPPDVATSLCNSSR